MKLWLLFANANDLELRVAAAEALEGSVPNEGNALGEEESLSV